MSALLALLVPAFHQLANQLPSQAPQGRNIVGAQIAIGSLFSLHILIAGLVSGAAELGPAIEFLGFVRQRRSYDRLAHGLGGVAPALGMGTAGAAAGLACGLRATSSCAARC